MRQKNYLTLEKAFANLEDVAYPDDKRIKMLAFILKEIYKEVIKINQTPSYSDRTEDVQNYKSER